ncbi:MAG: SDR family NAD(P)-dependent oxidoreductase [Pseudomonadota bacterium]
MAERSILITGCSSGIGLDAARALKARGWKVIATCRREADSARLRDEGLESFALDLTLAPSIAAGFERTLELTGGRLDALFNNGAYACPGALEDLPVEAMREIFEANFFGWHDLTRRTIAVMRQQGVGRIVQNSSVLGFAALPMRGAYVSTKFALEGYTETLRLELIGSGIDIALLEPGPIRTRIRQNSRQHFQRWVQPKKTSSVWRELYEKALEPRLFEERPGRDPGELLPNATTRAVIHALEARRPRTHYPVTTPTWSMIALKRVLPPRLLDRLLYRTQMQALPPAARPSDGREETAS